MMYIFGYWENKWSRPITLTYKPNANIVLELEKLHDSLS